MKPTIAYGAIVGKVIEHYRAQLGVHQKDLAAALAVSQSAYSRLEQGQSAMTVKQLRAIAAHLQTAPATILADADRFAAHLRSQGVEVTEENKNAAVGAVLIALGILAALVASGT